MNIKEAYCSGLLKVGRRVKTDGNLSTADTKAFTGRITKITSIDVLIDRDDGVACHWGVRLTNTVAQIVMLDSPSFEDVMKLKDRDECFIHHPVTNVLLRAIYRADCIFLRLVQYNSCHLSGDSKEELAIRIANKTFRVTGKRR